MFSYTLLNDQEFRDLMTTNAAIYVCYLYVLALVWCGIGPGPRQKRLLTATLVVLAGLPPLPVFTSKMWTLFGLQTGYAGTLLFIVSLMNIATIVVYFIGVKKINTLAYSGPEHCLRKEHYSTKPKTEVRLLQAAILLVTVAILVAVVT